MITEFSEAYPGNEDIELHPEDAEDDDEDEEPARPVLTSKRRQRGSADLAMVDPEAAMRANRSNSKRAKRNS
jgi:hypothetical protein